MFIIDLLKKLNPFRTQATKDLKAIAFKSAHIGINNYPGNNQDLNGCVNDANFWMQYFKGTGFTDQRFIKDEQATKQGILSLMHWVTEGITPGKLSVITYSGHGTQVNDTNDDEADRLDEVICPYDFNWQDHMWISDDDFHGTFSQKIPDGALLVFVADCCHSGTLHRDMSRQRIGKNIVPPPEIKNTWRARHNGAPKRRLVSDILDKFIVLSACTSSEVAYDCDFKGHYMGAFSHGCSEVLKKKPNLNYEDFIKAVKTEIREPQTPGYYGPDKMKNKMVFTL